MKKPRIGVFKFTSCDGCQLSILNLEEQLLDILKVFDVAYFREVSDKPLAGHFDIAVIEGSISTDRQVEEIIDVRERSTFMISIGACATCGGVQALKNWASAAEYKRSVYPSPEVIETLATSDPISEHVHVDYELWGCPPDNSAILKTLTSFLLGRRPPVPTYALCMECKQKGIPCILVSQSEPCLGPITKAGCGVLCPSLDRPCYGCFGPKEGANIDSLFTVFKQFGYSQNECMQMIDKMNTYAYRKEKYKAASPT
ncbi:MAG: oxidoreductase [Nitrospirota bacterium]